MAMSWIQQVDASYGRQIAEFCITGLIYQASYQHWTDCEPWVMPGAGIVTGVRCRWPIVLYGSVVLNLVACEWPPERKSSSKSRTPVWLSG